MNSQLQWYKHADSCRHFLEKNFSHAQIAVHFEQSNSGGVRAILKLNSPIGEPLFVSVQLQGPTLRFTVHGVVAGHFNAQTLANYNAVNLAPWAGRIYLAPDGGSTDLSLGAPVPAEPEGLFPIGDFLQVVFEAAIQLRSGQIPGYIGPAVNNGEQLFDALQNLLRQRGVPFAYAHNQEVIVIDTYTATERPVRLELFLLDRQVLVSRIHALLNVNVDSIELIRQFNQVNQLASAGALAWDTETKRIVGNVGLLPGLQTISDLEFDWATQRALELVDAGLNLAI